MATDKQKQIDEILHRCAILMANLGTKTKHDVATREKAKQIEQKWLQEIKTIDPEQYKMLVPDLQEFETQNENKSTE
jgi:ribosome assembly protein YihI (activator of Der GTPase)